MKVNIVDIKGKSKESLDISLDKSVDGIDSNVLVQYARIFQVNQRQGTSKIKDKSEVRGGGKKPWKQKGTGRARVGSIRSPLWVGGGAVHGPSPKNWNSKYLKSLKSKALKLGFVNKLNEDKVKVFDSTKGLEFSTKNAAIMLSALNVEGRVLVINSNAPEIFKSFRNIPFVRVSNIDQVNAYEVMASDFIVLDKESFEAFNKKFFEGE